MRYTFILLVLSVIFCSCSNEKDTKPEISIATLKGPSSVALIKLIDAKPEITGNRLHTQLFNNPVHLRPALLQKKVDYAVVPASMAALLFNKTGAYRIAAVTGWGNLYIVGKDIISSIEDLKSRKIHLMGKGVTPEAIFKYLMKKSSIKEEDLELSWKFPNPADLSAATAAGLTEFALLPEPYASISCSKNNSLKISLNIAGSVDFKIPQTVLIVKKGISTSDQTYKEVTRLCRLSAEWVNSNPSDAAIMVIKHKIVPSITASAIKRCNIRFVSAEESSEDIFRYFNILHSFNPLLIGGKMPDEEIIIR